MAFSGSHSTSYSTRYGSLELLAPILNLVSPFEFSRMCSTFGLKEIKMESMPLKKGKAFFVGFYRKVTQPGVPLDPLYPL
jgi:hypothetical protein